MRGNMKKVVFLLFIFIFLGCDPVDSRLTIINQTDRTLKIDVFTPNDSLEYVTLNKELVDFLSKFHDFDVNPNSEKQLSLKGNWEYSFENDTLGFRVFDVEKFNKNRTESPNTNYDIEKIIYVSKSYLEKHNWRVVIDSSKTPKIVKL